MYAMDPKPLRVSCGILQRNGQVLAVRRKAKQELGGKWEFPGGKIEGDETPEECLKRELREELALEIVVSESLTPLFHAYPHRAILLYPFICGIRSGSLDLKEHEDIRWDTPEKLLDLDWAEADRRILLSYLRQGYPLKRSNTP